MTLTIVTPWAGRHDLIPGYERVIAASGATRVLVIDNDGCLPSIKGAGVYHPGGDAGFSRANNIGLGFAHPGVVLFLNNDVTLTRPAKDWAVAMSCFLRRRSLVGARLRTQPHGDIDGRPFVYLDGWCLMGHTDELEHLGGWCEDYEEPAYYSDNDLALRAKRAGYKLIQAEPPLNHLENGTSNQIPRATIAAVTERNRQLFLGRARTLVAA